MTWVLNGNIDSPIEDDAPFTGADGTKYPANWDKSTVPGAVLVVETEKPVGAVITGSSIQPVNSIPTRVWAYRDKTAVEIWADARTKRDKLLASSDFRMLPDTANPGVLDAQSSNAWVVYRKALRDIPQTFSDPATVIWPETPKQRLG